MFVGFRGGLGMGVMAEMCRDTNGMGMSKLMTLMLEIVIKMSIVMLMVTVHIFEVISAQGCERHGLDH